MKNLLLLIAFLFSNPPLLASVLMDPCPYRVKLVDFVVIKQMPNAKFFTVKLTLSSLEKVEKGPMACEITGLEEPHEIRATIPKVELTKGASYIIGLQATSAMSPDGVVVHGLHVDYFKKN